MKNIVITIILFLTISASYSQTYLQGNITDESGSVIENANISVLETLKGTVSDEKGYYKIENLTQKTYFIKVSYVGYTTQINKLKLAKGKNELNIILAEASNQLEEIIVSGANQRLEKMQKAPVSISAITAKDVENLQINQISELNGIAPNFRSYDDGSTGGFTIIASRGISTIDNHPVVGFYVDDIPYFDGFSFPLTLQDVSQIEVLRGPQGTLYGRNSLAGVVRISTKKPVNNLKGYLKLGAGNFNAKDFTFAFNAPLVENKLFLRASTNVYDREGYLTNSFNNKKLQNRKAVDANIRLKYLANDRLSFDFLYNVNRKESDAYVFSYISENATIEDYLKDPYKANFNEDVNNLSSSQNLALKAKANFNSFDLSSILTYRASTNKALDEYDYTPLDMQSGKTEGQINNVTQEFRLTSNTDSKIKWNVGTFLYYINTKMLRGLSVGEDAAAADPRIPFAFTRFDDTENIQKGFSLYGQATYNITEKFALTGGLRYDFEEINFNVDRTFSNPVFPKKDFSQKADFNSVSHKVALSYLLNDDTMLFINVAKGYRPGGINSFVVDKDKAVYDPETTQNYELGVKSNLFKNRLKLNLTGFYISYKDQQIYTAVDITNFVFGLENIGESRIFGVELESKAVLTRGLTLGLNFGYLNAKVEKYMEKIINQTTGSITEADRKGKTLPVSPEFNSSANLQFIQPISKKINFEASTEYIYQSDIFFDVQNTAKHKAYGLLNARLGFTTKHFDFFVWGKNITDEAYFSYGYGASGFNLASYGLPQTYGANVTIKF